MLDTDTFLTAVYTLLDDLYQAELAAGRSHTPGRRPVFSDSEVLTVIIAQHWFRLTERAVVRRVRASWRHLFPTPITQSAFNRRGRGLHAVLASLVPRLAAAVDAALAPFEVVDGTSVPVERCCRAGRQHLLAPDCDFGKGGADRRFYWGCKLLLAVTPRGVITGFVAGPASTEERWLAEALFQGRVTAPSQPWMGVPPTLRRPATWQPYVGPNGPLWPRLGVGVPAAQGAYTGDRNYSGAAWQWHWETAYGATVVTPRSFFPTEQAALPLQASLRQIVETVNSHLKGDFGLESLQARTRWGLRSRLAGKLLAHNLGILLNQRLHRPYLAFATLVT